MSDKTVVDATPEVLSLLAQPERLPALVIVGLFALIWAFLIKAGNRHKAIELQIEEAKNDIILEIKEGIIRIMYETHLRQNRRKDKVDVEDDRRR